MIEPGLRFPAPSCEEAERLMSRTADRGL